MQDVKLLKTLTKAKRQIPNPKPKDIERFVFVGPGGQAEMKHVDVQNHEWKIEPSEGALVRVRLLNVMPRSYSRTECMTAASSIHRDLVAVADAMQGRVHISDTNDHENLALRLHAVAQRTGTGAVRTSMQLAGPANQAKAIGTNVEARSCYELTDTGRNLLLGMAGRHVHLGTIPSMNLHQFSALGYIAGDNDFRNPVEALRIHMRAETMSDAMIRRTEKRRRR